MSECCGKPTPPRPCCSAPAGGAAAAPSAVPRRFAEMIPNALAYAEAAKAAGRGVVGILCEFTPREILLAAGAVPVCLCGGSAEMIGPAEEHLPANLCPLIKSTFGYHVTGSNPFLEMADLLVAETTCDGKKKMYELLAESREMIVLELPQKADAAEGLQHWHAELGRFRQELADRLGRAIPDAALREAIARMNRERRLRRALAGLMRAENPPLTGRELIELKSSISGIEEDLAAYAAVFEALRGRSGPPQRAGRVRVLMTGVPMVHGAERVLEIIEGCGGLVVCMENCTGVKPILEDVAEDAPDPLRAIAEKYYHLPCSVMTRNDRRLETLRHLAGEYRAECIVELVWQACLTYDVESHYVRRLAEQMGIGYLRIETDYSPSDSARIAVRVEALFETVRGRRTNP